MIALAREALARVLGGTEVNKTRVTTPDKTYESERSNYAYCVDSVRQACRAANPGWLWGTNERAAAACQLENQPRSCPLPPEK